MIRFTVPGQPVSQNRAYRRNGRGPGMFMDSRAVAYKTAVLAHAKNAMRGHPTFRAPAVSLALYFKTAGSDVDGPIKLILDAMQGAAYSNDRQVARLVVEKHKDAAMPRTEIEISESGG